MSTRAVAIAALILAARLPMIYAAAPDLVPMPKKYVAGGASQQVSGLPLYREAGNRQCQIAAEELATRIRELGGQPGEVRDLDGRAASGIFILTVASQEAAQLAAGSPFPVTRDDPGTQGYVIHAQGPRVVIIGSDTIGALYGAMTLRQMMRAGRPGEVEIDSASVYDKPDFQFRSQMSIDRALKELAAGSPELQTAAIKAGLDTLMRFKVNQVHDYLDLRYERRGEERPNAQEENKRRRAAYRELNLYAAERGIYPVFQTFSHARDLNAPSVRRSAEEWPCVKHRQGLFCWSRDDLMQEKIRWTLDLYKECAFRVLWIHPVDGGGVEDPELWSRRCTGCREKWPEEERWKADAHMFALWTEALRREIDDPIFAIAVYPYSPRAGLTEVMGRAPGRDMAIWKRNTVDYWTKLHQHLDPMVRPLIWPDWPEAVARYRECFPGRAVRFYAHSFIPAGYFGTWHRRNGANYIGHPGDMFCLEGDALNRSELWMNVLCTNEFAWNTAAPGSEPYKGLNYDMETDHSGPPEVMDEWVPRACRALYGKEVGGRIAPVYQAGVLPMYIQDPSMGMAAGNRHRRFALIDLDPEGGDVAYGTPTFPDIEDNADRMATQVAATARAMEALESCRPFLDTLDPFLRRSVVHYSRRMPLWHAIARARHASYQARELQAAGRHPDAIAALDAGIKRFAEDWARAEGVLKELAQEGDITAHAVLGPRSDVRPTFDEMRDALTRQRQELDMVLVPRRPGPVLRVAIFDGIGAQGTLRFLEQFENVKADVISTLALPVLDRYDCVLIMKSTKLDRREYFEGLRRYVMEGGGGVLFQHDLCGYGRGPFGEETPFPEMCRRGERKDGNRVQVAADHAVPAGMKRGERGELMYYDHVAIVPGPAAETLVANERGEPVVVGGAMGHGKIIFDGSINVARVGDGSGYTESALFGINAAITQGAVEWFTGVPLRRRP